MDKSLKLAIMLISFGLVGCAQQPMPYKLVDSVLYEQGAMSGNYRFGVTEEKVNDKTYYVTVMLNGISSVNRAKNMAVYHAALIADSANSSYFAIEKPNVGNWCQWLKNTKTGQRMISDAGPKFQFKVELIDQKPSVKGKKKSKVFVTEQAKTKYIAKVNAPISSEAMDINTTKIMEKCWINRH